jgi:phospholipase A1
MVKSLSGDMVSRPTEVARYRKDRLFNLVAHRPNYLIPVSIVDNASSAEEDARRTDLDNLETEFQLSLKVAIWDGVFGKHGYLSGAYTARNFWQSYNSDNSAPFRETNHEPELMLTFANSSTFLGFKNPANRLMFNHQSNGRTGDFSRSWNRIMAEIILERDRWSMSFKPWYRIPEARVKDDNHDIERYLGHFEWRNTIAVGKGQQVSLMIRNNLRSDNKGAAELSWSIPISKNINGLVQYFNGYGQSLIDYNRSVEAIGFGVQISEWY